MIRYLSSWLWTHTTAAIVSFCRNLCYWMRHRGDWKAARHQMAGLSENITDLEAARFFMAKFIWREEGTDWTPWTTTAVHRYMTGAYDDCDGAAVLWRHLFACCGMPADIWHLRGDSGGHAVAITRDGRYMGSNAHLYEFREPKNWKRELLNDCFGGKYKYCYR